MPASYPYVNAPGPLASFLQKLRAAFPATISVDTLKKLGLASQNESYIINTLQFLGIIDEAGGKTDGAKAFVKDPAVFQPHLAQLVRGAYGDLFETHGDDAWTLPRTELTTFFRMSDGTSEIVGGRQAATFELLATEAGKREPSAAATKSSNAGMERSRKPRAGAAKQGADRAGMPPATSSEMAFSVRIELNLPATDDPKVYDAMFRSLRENLLEPYRS